MASISDSSRASCTQRTSKKKSHCKYWLFIFGMTAAALISALGAAGILGSVSSNVGDYLQDLTAGICFILLIALLFFYPKKENIVDYEEESEEISTSISIEEALPESSQSPIIPKESSLSTDPLENKSIKIIIFGKKEMNFEYSEKENVRSLKIKVIDFLKSQGEEVLINDIKITSGGRELLNDFLLKDYINERTLSIDCLMRPKLKRSLKLYS